MPKRKAALSQQYQDRPLDENDCATIAFEGTE
jgi:hypothetical protein